MPNNQNGSGGGPGNNNKKNWFGLASIAIWALILVVLFNTLFTGVKNGNTVEIAYSTFRDWVRQDIVSTVKIESNRFVITLKDGVTVTPDEETQSYIISVETPAPTAEPGASPADPNASPADPSASSADPSASPAPTASLPPLKLSYFEPQVKTYVTAQPLMDDSQLVSLMDAHGVKYYRQIENESSFLMNLLISYLLPMVIMIGGMVLLFRFMSTKMGGGMGGVGKANAKVYVEKKTGITFKDVAGQDEAKESLVEIIDFLHNPQKYTEIGARLPKGALLVGPPGTGKTLLAKAVAGEADVPFFSISGSDFVEMYVGVGASRVRDLFKEAAKMAPCIIFIDEIDTIGKSRNDRYGGGNDEREQTLNQLLAEMDGFDPTKGVILLAATNRPEVLDQALMRPGRFDRRITIDRPNLAGRLATLQVHTRNIRMSEDVDLQKIALATVGTVGADLANLVNEAALRAVRLGRKTVTQNDLLASFELVIAGTEKKGSVLTEFEKRLVAYHEVGHAMVAYKQKNTEPVQKITIVPHTQGSLGYTLLMPEEDKTELRTRDELMARIAVSMGGRAAEEVILNTMTNGAAQDIQDATGVARNMVALYGMSEKFGMMALASRRSQYLDGGYGIDCAQNTAADIDSEVRGILQTCYGQAVEVVKANRDDMEKVVAYLLKKETITGQEMLAILEGRDPATAENYGAVREERPEPAPTDAPIPLPPEGTEEPGRHGDLPH